MDSGYIDAGDWSADFRVDKPDEEEEREEQQTAKVSFSNIGECISPHRFEVTAIDLLGSVHDYSAARRSYKFITEREHRGGFFQRLVLSTQDSRHFIVGPKWARWLEVSTPSRFGSSCGCFTDLTNSRVGT